MRKVIASSRVFFLLALWFLTPPSVFAGPIESSAWIEVSREAGVIFKGAPLPKEGVGAGVVLPTLEVITAAHVVWGAKKISVANAIGTVVTAEIVRIDEDADIATLRIERPFHQFAAIRSKPVVAGERVSAVGLPRGNEMPTLLSANVGSATWTSNGVSVPLIFSGIKGEKGMSGGGLFDANGELVGIIIRIDGQLNYLNALPIVELCKRFLRCAATR
ncbi:MAG: serine protease [bacterium]|nr:serine protease [bacterium]